MDRTYLFYDIETSGLNKSFDQVLQFAAIRTDLELNELERHEILVRLNPDVCPSPDAFLTHQLTIKGLSQGIPEYEAITLIHKLLNAPGTISVGYNSLGFDDEFLRFSFHRNLLPPYTHQYANNCSRMDIYPIVVIFYLFKPQILQWMQIDGTNTFKLEYLNCVNNFAKGNAHEAMTDVLVLLGLARALLKAPEIWEYLCGSFNKKIDIDRAAKLSCELFNEGIKCANGLLVNGSFGDKRSYQCPVLGLGMHNHYKNQSLWLALDSPDLSKTTTDSIPETTCVYRKRFGEPPILLPVIPRFLKHLSSNIQEVVKTNISWLKTNPDVLHSIMNYYKEYKYPEVPNVDIDSDLYSFGFLTDTEQMYCNKFHEADLEGKISMLDKFPNDRMHAQAFRILGRNYYDNLPARLKEEFYYYLKSIDVEDDINNPVDYRGEKRLTRKRALKRLSELKQKDQLSDKQRLIIKELEEYYLLMSRNK